jgi:hypothetical protein
MTNSLLAYKCLKTIPEDDNSKHIIRLECVIVKRLDETEEEEVAGESSNKQRAFTREIASEMAG